LKVTSKETKTVAFSAGHGEPLLGENYEAIGKALQQEFKVTTAATAGGKLIPPTVNTLVVAGPNKIDDWDAFAIDQFIMHGGRVLFMMNKIEIAQGTLQASPVATKLDSLLAHYGAALRSDLVVDRSCGTASFSTGYFTFSMPYQLWPLVGESGFDKDSPITNQLKRAVFPWTSSIDLAGAAEKGIQATALAKSSPQSWVQDRQFNLDPQQDFKPMTDKAPRDLAVLLAGRFTSYFSGLPVPTPAGATAPPAVDRADTSPETQIIVMGNARFVDGPFLGQYPENRAFFLNAVDWLTLGESLIGIRSRLVATRPLKEIGEKSKASVRVASTLGVPLALIAWGLGRRYIKARRRRALQTTPDGR
jgi:ABC-type uncharacterized transport system involved in gliding motility auxiliary subunit